MIAAETENLWLQANQKYLVREFARLKARLGVGETQEPPSDETVPMEADQAAIDWLTEIFSLSPFERDLLLLCAGVEMDTELASLCAAACGQGQRAYATFGLALGALADPHWSALTPQRPLRRWRLLEVEDGTALVNRPLRIDERILHLLAGVNYVDARLQYLLRRPHGPAHLSDTHQSVAQSILTALDGRGDGPLTIALSGNDTSGQEDVAAHVAEALGVQLLVMRGEDVPTNAAELEALATLLERESILLPAALLLSCETQMPVATLQLSERLRGTVFIASREPIRSERTIHRFTIDKPGAAEQKTLWRQALGPSYKKLNGTVEALASHFSLSTRAILHTGATLDTKAGRDLSESLWQICRSTSQSRLDDLAQRIEPAATWDDLVLPAAQLATLKNVATHVRHRLTVYEDWGFFQKGSRGLGISALFAGESGTGKTMAAEVLANELRLDLYRIDLSSVVSKYIGETEKNLRHVFDAAEDSGAILLFDEADALFGKRSEVKDSHDRYANIEVSYLLQRMEAYRGLAILTTNLKAALDTAFQRRLRFVITFPFPDAQQRTAIWERIFPAATPTDAIDAHKLAKLQIAGGGIRNIAVNAAFLAASQNEPVRMAHLLEAAHTEATKRERPLSEMETRGWI